MQLVRHTAVAPPEAGEKKYDEIAVSMMAVLRYGSGVPWHRIEGFEANFGIPLPAATQCEILAANAFPLQPALGLTFYTKQPRVQDSEGRL